MQVPVCLKRPILPTDTFTAKAIHEIRSFCSLRKPNSEKRDLIERVAALFLRYVAEPLALLIFLPLTLCLDLVYRSVKQVSSFFSETSTKLHLLAIGKYFLTFPARLFYLLLGDRRPLEAFFYSLTKNSPSEIHPLLDMVRLADPDEVIEILESFSSEDLETIKDSMTRQEADLFDLMRISPGVCKILHRTWSGTPTPFPIIDDEVVKHLNKEGLLNSSRIIEILRQLPNSLLPTISVDTLTLVLSREGLKLFPETYLVHEIHRRSHISIQFRGEPGRGAGPRREFKTLLFRSLFQNNRLHLESNQGFPCISLFDPALQDSHSHPSEPQWLRLLNAEERELSSMGRILADTYMENISPIDTSLSDEFYQLLSLFLKKQTTVLENLSNLYIWPLLSITDLEIRRGILNELIILPESHDNDRRECQELFRTLLNSFFPSISSQIQQFGLDQAVPEMEGTTYEDLVRERVLFKVYSTLVIALKMRQHGIILEEGTTTWQDVKIAIHGQELRGENLKTALIENVEVEPFYRSFFSTWVRSKTDQELLNWIFAVTGMTRFSGTLYIRSGSHTDPSISCCLKTFYLPTGSQTQESFDLSMNAHTGPGQDCYTTL